MASSPEDSSIPVYITETQKPQASSVLYRSLDQNFLKVTSTDGIYLNLENGQRILDATGSPAVACLGHNNPDVKAAMIAQINSIAYCHSMFFTTEVTEQLCSNLIQGTGGKMSRAFIVSSGSEAIEAAIKMARQYFVELEGPNTKRQNFISRSPGFHGTTIGALSLGGHTVCAFAAETVVGSALGCVASLPGYFTAVRKVCDRYGALLILDEIMCGMGRCGYLHAWQSPEVNVVPDLQTIGKGLGGGYARISALLVGKKVVDVISSGSGSFNHGHTYQAHPVACAAALAVQKFVQDEGLVDKVKTLGEVFGAGLKKSLSGRWYVGDIRGAGLFWAIELVKNKQTKEPFHSSQQIGFRIHKVGISVPYSILLYPGGGYPDGSTGDHILLAPPYICSVHDIEHIVKTTARVLDDFFSHSDSPKEFEQSS